MKSIKKLPVAIAFLVVFMISFTPSYAATPGSVLIEPARNKTFWATGAGTNPTTFNPWLQDPEPWSLLMYDTLYAFNAKTN
ncbi:MAG: hypothetical protein KGD63_03105, partial [Candidatus Lokiarchaeota archaeon]|nr:hypothetical protein [Candidatus Lokiarchaeota archaeon]